MDDALLVGGVECVQNLPGVLQCLGWGQRALQPLALDELHYQVVGTNVVQLTDVGMIEQSDGAGFALRALGVLFHCDLDRHKAIQTRIPSFIDLSHSARTYGREDLVGAQASTRR